MWQCPKCREKLEDTFDVCWSCGTSRDGTEDPTFQKEEGAPAEKAEPERQPQEIRCRDCGVAASPPGQIAFMKKSDNPFWGLVAAFTDRDAANLETFPVDVFRCPQCGRLELYDLDRSLPQREP